MGFGISSGGGLLDASSGLNMSHRISGSAAVKQEKRENSHSAGPRSLARVLQILGILSEHQDGQTLGEICLQLGAPRSSTFALLQPLTSLSFLARSQGRYQLGPAAFSLGAAISNARDDARIVKSVMDELSDMTGHTIMYSESIPAEHAIVHRHLIQSRRAIRYVARVNTPRPLATTASGRAVLAHADPKWTSRYLDSVKVKPTLRYGSPSRRKLDLMLERVRHEGYSSSLGDFDAGVGAICAPILDSAGVAVGSIGVSGPVVDIRAEFDSIARAVKLAGRDLSKALAAPLPRHQPTDAIRTNRSSENANIAAPTPKVKRRPRSA